MSNEKSVAFSLNATLSELHALPVLSGALREQNDSDCFQDNLDVQQERHIFSVIEIVFQLSA